MTCLQFLIQTGAHHTGEKRIVTRPEKEWHLTLNPRKEVWRCGEECNTRFLAGDPGQVIVVCSDSGFSGSDELFRGLWRCAETINQRERNVNFRI